MMDDSPPAPERFDRELTALFDREADRLVAYLVSADRGLAWQDAEDVAQEAFLVARARWAQVRDYEHPVGFVFQTAELLARNHARAVRRRAADPLTDQEWRSAATSCDLEAAIDLQAGLDRLSVRQRQVVLLRHLVGFGVRETSAILDVSVGTVKSTCADALRRLRSMLDSPDGSEGDGVDGDE